MYVLYVCAISMDCISVIYTSEICCMYTYTIAMRFCRLFNHGLWPENSYVDYMQRFQVHVLISLILSACKYAALMPSRVQQRKYKGGSRYLKPNTER